MPFSRTTRSRLLLLALVATLVTAVGPARVGLDHGAKIALRIDEALQSARTALFGEDPPVTVDLGDGRSPVPTYWQTKFERFAAEDRAQASVGGVVFVGGSSIDYWNDLEAQFPAFHIVRRGLAGATMADCTRHLDRLVLPSRPRLVVVYAGDNDLAAGATPEQVVTDYADMVRRVQHALPDTRFVFVSIKPSLARETLIPAMRRTNALMASFAATDRRLDFVDVFDPMLTPDGHPRRELFRKDGLHMTGPGYAIWRDALTPHLD